MQEQDALFCLLLPPQSGAYVYSLMDQRQKKELMDAYFSPKRMGYRLARIHMDSCDAAPDTLSSETPGCTGTYSPPRLPGIPASAPREAARIGGRGDLPLGPQQGAGL